MPKKIPQRQCVACRQHFDKRSLGRVVKKPDGTIVFDKTGKVSGRGAYVCLNKECFKNLVLMRQDLLKGCRQMQQEQLWICLER